MTFLGMVPDQVRDHAERTNDASQRLTDLQERLDALTRGVTWVGPDRDAFEQQWFSGPRMQLSSASDELAQRAQRLREEADEQDEVSSAGDGTAPAERMSLTDWLSDRFRSVTDWFSDRFDEAKQWVGDRIDDLKKWASDWWADHTSDRPWAEIATEKLVDQLIKHDQLHHRADVDVHGIREIEGSRAPQSLDDLILANDETRRTMSGSKPPHNYDSLNEAQVRIQKVVGDDGVERYVVHVPPTQGAPLTQNLSILGKDTPVPDPGKTLQGWDEQGQPFGWDNNLYAMAGMENAGANAVKAAMEEAGIPPGSEVAFVAHSQGGLVASQLAADPTFNGGQYTVTDVFSVGSPTQTYTPAAETGTDVLNVHHAKDGDRGGDFVPGLDLDGRSTRHPFGNPAPNVHEAEFGTPAGPPGPDSPTGMTRAHESVFRDSHGNPYPDSGYYGTVRNNHDDPSLMAKDQRMRGMYYGDGTQMVEDVVVDVSRK